MMKGKYANAWIHVTSGLPSPQAGLLTGSRVIPIVPVENLTFIELLLKQLHCGIMVCLLLRVMSCSIFNMLVESSLDLLSPFVDVADPVVEVVKPLSDVTIPPG
jgi:hypothetical protein